MSADKKKIEIIITAGFVLILIFILFNNIIGTKNRKALIKKGKALSKGLSNTVDKKKEIVPVKVMGWGRDPFIFGETRTAEGGLVLNGIAWDETNPSAIINNTVVRIGDGVGGNRVVDIQKNRVILSKDVNTYELNLRGGGE